VSRNFVICFGLIGLLCLTALAQSDQQPPLSSSPVPANIAQDFQQNAQDIYFDFDRAELTPEASSTLSKAAEWLKLHPEVSVTISGIADERGSVTYNLALSQRRAEAARDALVQSGVSQNQILFATGWGKLYPVCTDSNDSCWTQNRRSHLSLWADTNTWLASGARNWQENSAITEAQARQ